MRRQYPLASDPDVTLERRGVGATDRARNAYPMRHQYRAKRRIGDAASRRLAREKGYPLLCLRLHKIPPSIVAVLCGVPPQVLHSCMPFYLQTSIIPQTPGRRRKGASAVSKGRTGDPPPARGLERPKVTATIVWGRFVGVGPGRTLRVPRRQESIWVDKSNHWPTRCVSRPCYELSVGDGLLNSWATHEMPPSHDSNHHTNRSEMR